MKEITAEEWEHFYNIDQMPWDTPWAQEEVINIINYYSILPCTILDIGCGTGSLCIELSKKGFDVTGIDVSPTAIKLANTRLDGMCKFEVVDIFKKSLNKKFHLITDVGCFHHILDNRFVEIVAQYLHPGGIWYSCVGSKERRRKSFVDNIETPVIPAHSIQDIITVVDKLFEIILIRTFNFGIEKGGKIVGSDGYPFWSCLMRKRNNIK